MLNLARILAIYSAAISAHIKKNNFDSVQDVYALLGIDRHCLFRWKAEPEVTHTRNRKKHKAIAAAGEVFGLDADETEALANKAGLSLCLDGGFYETLGAMLEKYQSTKRHLCKVSMISDRSLRHLKNEQYLRKETILAVAISLGADLESIQDLLKRAGYILSDSLYGDAVVKWMLRNQQNKDSSLLESINGILDEHGLTLLMARGWEKSL